MKMKISLPLLVIAGFAVTAPAVANAGDPAKGQQVFRQYCRACHGVDPGVSRSGGPNLSELAKGQPAAVDSTFEYSPAFRAAKVKGFAWSEKTLNDFLADPARVIPETTMPVGVAGAEDRANLVAFLLSRKK